MVCFHPSENFFEGSHSSLKLKGIQVCRKSSTTWQGSGLKDCLEECRGARLRG